MVCDRLREQVTGLVVRQRQGIQDGRYGEIGIIEQGHLVEGKFLEGKFLERKLVKRKLVVIVKRIFENQLFKEIRQA